MTDKVLVIGSGGREHALCWKLSQSPAVEEVYCAPGSDGIALVATCVNASTLEQILSVVREASIDLVVVGPEQPLVAGWADGLRSEGVEVFGPGADGARLEGDKAYAKEFMSAAAIPTAEAVCFDRSEAALAHVRAHPGPCVVKATGLAAGKGVILCANLAEAEAAIRTCMEEAAFGEAGQQILVEEMLEGPELSVFAVLDGERIAYFAPSRDHKRIGEGDTGPNTGGMGAFTPVRDADDALMTKVVAEILEPSVTELRRRGIDYRGLLYVGLMLTAEGPKVLEFNCRFGDPETQVVLPAYRGDLYGLLKSAARGHLEVEGALDRRGAAVGLVLASAGYPGSSQKGVPIEGIDAKGDHALVFHAGTRRGSTGDPEWRTDGGRVLCAVAWGETIGEARRVALSQAEQLKFEGAQLRRDIAAQEES